MAFVRSASPTYFAPASHNILGADGELIVSKFDCQFKRLKRSEQVALRRDNAAWGEELLVKSRIEAEARAKSIVAGEQPAPISEDINAMDRMVSRRVIERVMTGWRAVEAKDGSALPYSMAALDELEEEFPGFMNACARAYWESCEPVTAAHLAAKN